MDKKFIILADSTCDLNKELRERFDIEYVSGMFTWPDGTEERGFLDWADCKHMQGCTEKAFYTALKKSPNGFKTSPPNIYDFAKKFEEFISQGYGVLAFAVSSTLGGAYSMMCNAQKQIKEKYPEAEIYCIDSRRYGSAMGLLAIYASMMRAEGKTLKETADYIEENKLRFHQSGWLDDLSFVAKKGRINNAAAFFGTLIGIKPIGVLDPNGMVTTIGKVKGESLALKVITSYIGEIGENLEGQTILIAQSMMGKQAEIYKNMIIEKYHPREVLMTNVYPIDGINMGPGLIAAYFLGKPTSEDLSQEKAALEKSIAANK